MSIPSRVNAAVKGLALWAGLSLLVFAVVLTAIGFLITGFLIWLEQFKSHAVAAAITGGALLIAAVIVGIVGSIVIKKTKKRQPSIIAEFTGVAGTAGRIAGLLIRRDPRKSLILAVIAGALAEYITSDSKKRD
jgi:chromate transport protein ChrA